MTWQAQPIHVLDFEGSHRYGVIEYGVVTIHQGAVSACRTRLCEAEDAIDERDSWMHGLRRKDTEGFPPFRKDWEFFNGLRAHGPLAAHHAGVEHRLLKRSWPYPSTAPDYSQCGREIADWGPWLDTRLLYQRLFPELTELKLASLMEHFSLQSDLDKLSQDYCPPKRRRYHCALYDALAAALLLLKLAELPAIGQCSLRTLYAVSLNRPGETQAELF